jgi:hypothetical protein
MVMFKARLGLVGLRLAQETSRAQLEGSGQAWARLRLMPVLDMKGRNEKMIYYHSDILRKVNVVIPKGADVQDHYPTRGSHVQTSMTKQPLSLSHHDGRRINESQKQHASIACADKPEGGGG